MPPTPTSAAPAAAPYVSLGDSIADAEGATSKDKGYVALFAAQAWQVMKFPGTPAARIDFGRRGGETSSSMRAPGGQLDLAVAEIVRRNSDTDPANDVRLITLDIGGNDFLALSRAPSPCTASATSADCQAAVATVVRTYSENLPVILGRLRAAAPNAIILVGTFYNPFSGTGAAFDAPGDAVVTQIANVGRQVAASPQIKAVFVDLVTPFQGKAPVLTRIAETPPNIHPNDAGHAALANAFTAALRSAATPPPGAPATGSGAASGESPLSPASVLAAGALLFAGSGSLAVVARRRCRRA